MCSTRSGPTHACSDYLGIGEDEPCLLLARRTWSGTSGGDAELLHLSRRALQPRRPLQGDGRGGAAGPRLDRSRVRCIGGRRNPAAPRDKKTKGRPMSVARSIDIVPGEVRLAALRRIAREALEVSLGDDDMAADRRLPRRRLDKAIAEGRTIYGVNTGFGKLAETRIGEADLATLQRNLILSHCTGSGPELGDDVIRLVLALKVIGAGARPFRRAARDRRDASRSARARRLSLRPVEGLGRRVGRPDAARAPLGDPDRRRRGDASRPADAGRRRRLPSPGYKPIELGAEGGARADQRHAGLDGAGAVGPLRRRGRIRRGDRRRRDVASRRPRAAASPFDARIHAVRGQQGQIDVAAAFRRLFDGSGIMAAHRNRHRVQDPYSLRCQPQVMGALPRCAAPRRAHRSRSRRTPCPTTRSSSPRTATCSPAAISTPSRWRSCADLAGDRAVRDRGDLGAADRVPGRHEPQRPAAVPGRVERAQLRLHGGADLGGGARLREQDAGASGERRLHPDRRQPGGPCQHGDLRGAAARRDRRQCPRHRRDRAYRRGAGFGFPAAAEVVAFARRKRMR